MPPSRLTFLSADWKHLLLFNYAVPDEVLVPYLPPEVELDRFCGNAFLSLVGFQFLNTRVLGIPWPGFVNFPEINLRFYIRHQGRRGVCFIREFVPSRLVAGLAKALYNEPYEATAMTMEVYSNPQTISSKYSLTKNNSHFSLKATAKSSPFLPDANSLEHFFKEHDLGVGKSRSGKLLKYEVSHPLWTVFPVENAVAEIDWETIYGNNFAFLQNRKPDSVCFAEGSPIKVYWKSS